MNEFETEYYVQLSNNITYNWENHPRFFFIFYAKILHQKIFIPFWKIIHATNETAEAES